MADSLHLKLAGLPPNEDGTMSLPVGGFVAEYDDFVSSVLFCPEDVKTLELYDLDKEKYFSVYKILGGLPHDQCSTHVTLSKERTIAPDRIEVMALRKIAIINRFDIFPVHNFTSCPKLER